MDCTRIRNLTAGLVLIASLSSCTDVPPPPDPATSDGRMSDLDMPRPIDARDNLWVEDLTWLEARDAIAAGKETVIVPTGGVEQNGPYTVAGKHNYIVRAAAEVIAGKLENALIAPVIAFVPEGQIDPPTGHMAYPPTISLEEETYRALLRDIARSMRAHGFRNIVFIGDSGGNQPGMKAVAAELDAAWREQGARAIYVPEYYDWQDRAEWLAGRGYQEIPEGIHDELSVQAILMSVDPNLIRLDERRRAGLATINGVSVESEEEIAQLGRDLLEHMADKTVTAIQSRLGENPQ